jgi:hypothetical protein
MRLLLIATLRPGRADRITQVASLPGRQRSGPGPMPPTIARPPMNAGSAPSPDDAQTGPPQIARPQCVQPVTLARPPRREPRQPAAPNGRNPGDVWSIPTRPYRVRTSPRTPSMSPCAASRPVQAGRHGPLSVLRYRHHRHSSASGRSRAWRACGGAPEPQRVLPRGLEPGALARSSDSWDARALCSQTSRRGAGRHGRGLLLRRCVRRHRGLPGGRNARQ